VHESLLHDTGETVMMCPYVQTDTDDANDDDDDDDTGIFID
jgi:hypothetical protein